MMYKIREILEQKGFVLKRTGELLRCSCPFHHDPVPSFVVYPKTNSFYCFGCNVGGGPIQLFKLFGEKVPVDLLNEFHEKQFLNKHGDFIKNLFKENPIKKLRRIIYSIRTNRQNTIQVSRIRTLNNRVLRVAKIYKNMAKGADS